MRRPKAIAPLVLALALGVGAAAAGAAYGEQYTSISARASVASTAATKAQTAARTGVSVKVRNSPFGRMLFSGGGQAIYLFAKEKGSKSKCYGACSRAWPPVLTRGNPSARSGVDQSKLGTTKRRGGQAQVTYGGHPLYYYVDDPVNKVLCQDVTQFGAKWYVVSPSGRAIT